jgi:hypothetical protein
MRRPLSDYDRRSASIILLGLRSRLYDTNCGPIITARYYLKIPIWKDPLLRFLHLVDSGN